MKKRYTYFLKNMGLLTISNFASKILVLLLIPLYTSVLTTKEYGIYDLVVSTVNLIYPVLTANIVDAVMRFSMDKNYDNRKVAIIGIWHVFLSIVFFMFFSLLAGKFQIFQYLSGLWWYIGIYYACYVLNQFFIQFAKGLEKVADMGVAGVLSTIIMAGTNILFLLVFKLGLEGFFAANILAQAISILYFFFRTKFWCYFGNIKIDYKLRKEMLVYCIPLIITILGWWVNNTLDKYIVACICGVAANGILSVSYKIPSIINTLHSIFVQAWQISAIKEYGGAGTASFYGEMFCTFNVVMSAACAWLIILSKPVATILYAKDFYEAWRYAPFLLISSVLNCASGLLGPILAAKKDSKSLAISAVYGILVNIILNILLVHKIGVQGATIATVISSYIIYAIRRKTLAVEIKIEQYYVVVITWIILCVQAFLEIYTSFWYAEAVLMLIMLWINKNRMMKIIIMGKNIIKNKIFSVNNKKKYHRIK